jgi:hypothetical protein
MDQDELVRKAAKVALWAIDPQEATSPSRHLLVELAVVEQHAASPIVPHEPAGCREFRLSDAMILLAGLAISLSMGAYLFVFFLDAFRHLCREALDNVMATFVNPLWFWSVIERGLRNTFWYGLQVLEILLGGMIPAFLVIRLRRPRPPLRCLIRQPGTVAAVAAVFGLFWVTGWLHILFADRITSESGAAIAAGGTVALAWIVLSLSGWGIAEPGWIDRLGRLLGIASVTALFLGLIIFRV